MVVVGLTLGSCKKKDNEETEDDATEQTELSSDENIYDYESNKMFTDANQVIFSNRLKIQNHTSVIRSGTYDDTTFMSQKKIVITYNGDGYNEGRSYNYNDYYHNRKKRTGIVSLQLINGNLWTDVGAVLKVDAINFKVTYLSLGKSITINGTHYITNVSGGEHLLSDNVIHRIRGNVEVAFDDNSARQWQVARLKTMTRKGETIAGDTTVDGYDKVIVWGSNRAGTKFYTQASQTIEYFSENCSYLLPTAGIKVHNGLTRAITVAFGVDASGNANTINSCPYGFKINWVNKRGKLQTKVIPY